MSRTNFYLSAFLLLGFLSIANNSLAQSWDWHITGGTIVDGSGQGSYQADLLIKGDSIGYIGKVNADTVQAGRTTDATGKIVSPGFVDVHAHGSPLKTPEFQNFLAMGVTTIVLGQDGSSPKVGALEEWFGQVEKAGPAVNVAVLSGHGSIRSMVGAGKRGANEQELRRMEELLRTDLKAGAFGLSTGLEYVPGLYADQNEMERLARITGQHETVLMSHMRSEDDTEIEASLDELAAQGQYSKVHASHLKVVYGEGADRAEEILNYIQSFREKGIEISADTYPYAASFTGIGIVFPEWAKTEEEWRQAAKERPGVLRQFLTQRVKQRNGPQAILFGTGKYAGHTLKEAAEQEGQHPIELLMNMGPQAASAAHFVMNEELQDRLAVDPEIMISSDGSPTMRHPRGYGSFAKVIHRYVNQQQALSVEEAVYKMSGLPAATLGLENRGTLKEGHKADLIIFNPEEVRDKADFENPHQLAEGFKWVMINGQIAREEEGFSEQRFGKVLKRK